MYGLDFEYSGMNEYRLLSKFLKLYGIDIIGNTVQKRNFTKMCLKIPPVMMHFTGLYILYACLMEYWYSSIETEGIVSFVMGTFLTVILWHATYLRRNKIKNLVKQFRKINDLKKQNSKNIVAFIKFGVAMSVTIPLTTLLLINVFIHENNDVELFYSFYISIKDETKGAVIRFCTSLLINTFQFTFPCLICVMCAVLFYNFSLLIGCFCKDLEVLKDSRNVHRCSILSNMRLHQLLYQVANDLLDATSFICFLSFSIWLGFMYVALLIFMTECPNRPAILELVPLMVLGPFSIVIVTVGASRISSQVQQSRTLLHSIQDYFVCKHPVDWEAVELLKIMINKPFPTMTAWGIVLLTPHLILSMFGSFLTYGLLIVNLRQH